MDPRERYSDLEETLRILSDGIIGQCWTALVGIVTKVTNNGNTLEIQPATNGRVRQTDGTYKYLQMPQLVDVPIHWPRGGGATFTFPIAVNDEVLVIISSRCIDAWWQQGYQAPKTSTDANGKQTGPMGADGKPFNPANNPPKWRVNNLSDAFAIPGVLSLVNALSPPPSTTAAELRTADRSAFFSFNPTAKSLAITMPGGVNINGVTIDSSGNTTSPATITGQTEVVAKTGGSAVHLSTHTHSGVSSGTSNTGSPNGGS